MALTVVGSIAFDAVTTPFGERERMLGGAAVHFSLAASFFTEVRPVGPVGDDFATEQFEVLERRGILCDDIERVEGGKSFFWRGRYEFDLNVAHTEDTRQACLDHINQHWTDMRPQSLIDAMDAAR